MIAASYRSGSFMTMPDCGSVSEAVAALAFGVWPNFAVAEFALLEVAGPLHPKEKKVRRIEVAMIVRRFSVDVNRR